MNWVTWEIVGVDRMACAWLIRRFIDPEATFMFVPAGQTPLPDGAEPFDIPGVRLSHHRGHCTFHTMVRTFELAAPGLDLICRGLQLTSPDDQVALERGALIYDALYAQLNRVSSTPEP